MSKRALLAAISLVFVPACGQATRDVEMPQPPPAPASPSQRYEANAMVLESDAHEPMLCLGAVLESLPPQCGDVPITNWNWDDVAGEERRSDTVWGSYHVVGTLDDGSFTVIEVAAPRKGEAVFGGESEIGTPCPVPPGGWQAADPARTTEQDRNAGAAAAGREPDFAGLWIDHVVEPDPNAYEDTANIILNVAFTGDLERHESELRQYWGGPLCLTRHDHTYRELRRIQDELTPTGGQELGLQVLSSNVDVVRNFVELGVVVIDAETQRALDARYGAGTVRASGALRPVS